jgi:hypothetical protein
MTSEARMSKPLNDSMRQFTAELRAVGLLTVAYFLLARGWSVLFGVLYWPVVFVAIFTIVWLLALRTAWRHRADFSRFDRVMLYLPLLVWALAFVLIKTLLWRLTHGAAVWGAYGGDKGFANMLFEPAIVGCAASLYFSHWWLTSHGFGMRRVLITLSFVGAVAVAVFVPALPE